NTIAIQVCLAFDVLIEVHIEIGDELLPGEDRDSLRSEIVGVRSITLTHRDHIERLLLSGRSETTRCHCRDRGDDLSGFTSGCQRIRRIARIELRIAPVGIGEIPAKYLRQNASFSRL